jgi:hypothetical protein
VRYLKQPAWRFAYVDEIRAIYLYGGPTWQHEVIAPLLTHSVYVGLNACLRSAPPSGHNRTDNADESEKLNEFMGKAGSPIFTLETRQPETLIEHPYDPMQSKGRMDKEPDGVVYVQRPFSENGRNVPILVVEVAVHNEPIEVAVWEAQLWAQTLASIALAIKVEVGVLSVC